MTTTAPQFQRVRSVTLPVLKLEKNQTRYLAILGAMHKGKKIDDQKEAATICRAVDMSTGEEGQVICPTVMEKELNENYPGETYVGRGFEVTLTRVPDKRYNIVSLAEVSIPAELEATIDKMRRNGASASATAAASAKKTAK
jgi:hypothetical protein